MRFFLATPCTLEICRPVYHMINMKLGALLIRPFQSIHADTIIKSSSSRILPGRASLGRLAAWQVEHFSSSAACALGAVGAEKELRSRPWGCVPGLSGRGMSLGLANIVILTLVAWEGLIRFLLAKSSHGSHSSSARSSPVPLSENILRRSGAVPRMIFSGGANVLLALGMP